MTLRGLKSQKIILQLRTVPRWKRRKRGRGRSVYLLWQQFNRKKDPLLLRHDRGRETNFGRNDNRTVHCLTYSRHLEYLYTQVYTNVYRGTCAYLSNERESKYVWRPVYISFVILVKFLWDTKDYEERIVARNRGIETLGLSSYPSLLSYISQSKGMVCLWEGPVLELYEDQDVTDDTIDGRSTPRTRDLRTDRSGLVLSGIHILYTTVGFWIIFFSSFFQLIE